MLEFEKKFRLSSDEYKALCIAYTAYLIQTHVNFYYDTEDYFYNRKGITCRIRKKGEIYKATIKTHRLNIMACSMEKTSEVKDEFDTSAFEGMNVILHGQLWTERKVIKICDGIKVMLDKNIYLGMEDYELEIEYSPQLEQFCDNFLRGLIMKLSNDNFDSLLEDFYQRMREVSTKSERFFARKIKMQEN